MNTITVWSHEYSVSMERVNGGKGILLILVALKFAVCV